MSEVGIKSVLTPLIIKGEIVVCPNFGCGKVIAKITRDIFRGDEIQATLFESETAVPIKNGDRPNCPACKANWIAGSQIHIFQRGWV